MAPVGVLLGLTALAAAGRMVFLWAPNVAPTFFIAFVAGVAYGARAGAFVGGFSMLVTDLVLSALHPVLVVNTSAMAAVGAAGGLLGRAVDFGQARDLPRGYAAALAGLVGVLVIVGFSLLSDAVSYALFYRSGAEVFRALVLAGLAFNALPAVVNGVLFATATYPVLRALRKAGLAAAR